MQCPYLKKIVFEKIHQVRDQDSEAYEDQPNEQDQMYFDSIVGDQPNFASVNKSQTAIHQYYDFDMHSGEDIKLMEIKIPKSLNIIKKLSHKGKLFKQQQEEDNDIPNQTQNSQLIMSPHVLMSKMGSVMSITLRNFKGDVAMVKGQQRIYHCTIENGNFKISKQNKIKYFIHLGKNRCEYSIIGSIGVKITATCKNHMESFTLFFRSDVQRNAFTNVIEEYIKEAENIDVDLHEIDSLGYYVQRISMQELAKTADTFDIILFKNMTLMSKMQRILTNSDYDHAAVLLKTSTNELLMLQCTSNMGVGLYSFQSMLRIPKQKYFMRLGYRRFTGQKTDLQYTLLQKFVKNSIGKKYKFDPRYLINKVQKKQQTFFCSELIAQLLQQCKIMSCQNPSYEYLPKHLADEQLNKYIIKGQYTDVIIIQ